MPGNTSTELRSCSFPIREGIGSVPACSRSVLDTVPISSYGIDMARNTPTDSWDRVGQTIRSMREMRGLRADALATQVGISRPYLANIEAGRKPLTPVLLAKIAEALYVPQIAILDPVNEDAA